MLINEELLDEVTAKAKASERLRMNHNLHDRLEAKAQRLLNALEPGTILPIHRHRHTAVFGMVTTDSYWDKEKMESVLSINPTSLFDRMIFIDKEVDVMRVESREGLKIFQLKIALRGVEPPIWRRIQVPSSLLVGNLLSSGHQRERVKSDCRHHMRHVKPG